MGGRRCWSWAANECNPGVYSTKFHAGSLRAGKAFLIAFPLDKVPKGQRITNAELVIPVHHVESEQRLTIRRILGDWGAGVCYKYRMRSPQAGRLDAARRVGPRPPIAPPRRAAAVRISARRKDGQRHRGRRAVVHRGGGEPRLDPSASRTSTPRFICCRRSPRTPTGSAGGSCASPMSPSDPRGRR